MSNNKQRLWIVSESFYPEELSTSYILTQVASALSSKYEVHVVCGPLNSKKGRANQGVGDILPSVNIKRMHSLNLDVNNLLLRIIKFIILSLQLFTSVVLHVRKRDKVMIVTNPAPLLVLISFYKKVKGFELTILVHDIFPENAIPAGILSSDKSWKYQIQKFFFDRAYSYANKLIVLGRDMRSVVTSKIVKGYSPKIEVIENWGDVTNINCLPIREDIINIQYAGNIGRVQGIFEFLEVVSNVHNQMLNFEFVGDGATKKELQQKVFKENLMHIQFFDSYRREQQTDVLGRSTFALVTLASGMYGLGVPSKSYNIMAAGRPILFIGDLDSEIALLIQEHNIGYCFRSEDREKLIVFLNSLTLNDIQKFNEMGKTARQLAETYFSEAKILNKFVIAI